MRHSTRILYIAVKGFICLLLAAVLICNAAPSFAAGEVFVLEEGYARAFYEVNPGFVPDGFELDREYMTESDFSYWYNRTFNNGSVEYAEDSQIKVQLTAVSSDEQIKQILSYFHLGFIDSTTEASPISIGGRKSWISEAHGKYSYYTQHNFYHESQYAILLEPKSQSTRDYDVYALVVIDSHVSVETQNLPAGTPNEKEKALVKDCSKYLSELGKKTDAFVKGLSFQKTEGEEVIPYASVLPNTETEASTEISPDMHNPFTAGGTFVQGVGQVPAPGNVEQVLTAVLGSGLVSVFLSLLGGSVPVSPVPPATAGTASVPTGRMTRTLREFNGRRIKIEYDSDTGKWYNTETGNEFDPDRFQEWKSDTQKNMDLSHSDINKMSRRETAFDKDTKNMLERQKEKSNMLQNLQQMEKNILFGSESAQSLYDNRGGPGDVIAKIHELKEKLSDSPQFDETKKAYQKVREVYGGRITGETLSEKDLPTDGELLSETISDAASSTLREIATRSSYKSMALRALAGYMTGGASEYGFATANALYGMKDYSDEGGDSVFEAFKNQTKQLLLDELTDRVSGKVLDTTLAAGSKVVDEVMDQVKGRLKDYKKAIYNSRKNQFAEKLNESLEKADADNADLIERVRSDVKKDPEFLERSEYFKKGREAGTKKVAELEEARKRLELKPDSGEAADMFNKAVEHIQMDKHAMQQLNAVKGPEGEAIRKAFNKRMAAVYNQSLESARIRLAKEYGVSVDDIKIVNPTNVKGGSIPKEDAMGFAKGKKTSTLGTYNVDYTPRVDESAIRGDKVSFDKDVTFRVKQKTRNPRTGEVTEGFADVPKAETKRVYDEEFYKANHNGELPKKPDGNIDIEAIDDYAKKMDQATTDRLDAEAYGIGDRDLQTSTMDAARGRDLMDVEAVGKTMEFKSNEWANKAHEARRLAEKALNEGNPERTAELLADAEGFMEESMRQTTKQFDNMVVKRIIEANAKAGFPTVPVAKIPLTLQKAIGIMKKVGKPDGLTVAEAEKALELMNLTPKQVAEMNSSLVEGLQKLGS